MGAGLVEWLSGWVGLVTGHWSLVISHWSGEDGKVGRWEGGKREVVGGMVWKS